MWHFTTTKKETGGVGGSQATSIPMLVPQTLKNALGRVALLFDKRFVGAQNLVDSTNITIKSWSYWCF